MPEAGADSLLVYGFTAMMAHLLMWLGRFSWFRRKQQLHFIHHRHGNYNFAVIDFFWDRLLGTYRRVESETSVASRRPCTTATSESQAAKAQ
jgi:sterol desaturase/sphingolipid hydroxylase (fatty acid hydroxylase superfamily)